ncbi:MAG: hypothetical protein EA420_01905 [Candidatus Competibacteraceae bacterium]|nr:MAG: hypothetical protein EA420_01905 [Candidatus Competibacteraceae bacterium]
MLSEKAIALLARAFIQLLGKPASGSMAYVRCLPPDATRALAAVPSFKVPGWQTAAVVETAEPEKRWITADQAVAWRNDKREAALLLIDATAAGPGMDGIYSAAREIGERELFDVAHRLAHDALPYGCKLFVKKALTKARQVGHQRHLAPWRVFTYLCRATHSLDAVGTALPEIGLWPVAMSDRPNEKDLDKAALLADKIFPTQGARLTPEQRVSALNLNDPEAERQLIQRLRATERLPRLEALADLARESDFWINRLSSVWPKTPKPCRLG